MNKLINALSAEGRGRIAGVVVAVSAPVDRRFRAVVGGLLPDWELEALDKPITEMLSSDAPVVIVNDANARAIGEGRFGLARAAHSAFVLKVSSGIGGALLRRGRVLDGYRGLAGEIGHFGISLDFLTRPPKELNLPLLDPDALCSCQDIGGQHLEAYASTTAIARRVSAARGKEVSFEAVAAEWRTASDAQRTVEDAARLLGFAVSAVVTLCDPQVIVIRGRFAAAGSDAVDPVRKAIAAARPFRRDPPEVLVADPRQDGGKADDEFDWMGVRGAGRLAIELNTSADDPPE